MELLALDEAVGVGRFVPVMVKYLGHSYKVLYLFFILAKMGKQLRYPFGGTQKANCGLEEEKCETKEPQTLGNILSAQNVTECTSEKMTLQCEFRLIFKVQEQ